MAYIKTGQGFEKNKRKPHEFWPFQMTASVAVICVVIYCYLKKYEAAVLLYDALLTFLALFLIWYHWVKSYRQDRLSYDNGEHPCRFWFCVGIGFLAEFCMCFLPAGNWYGPVGYLLLTLFGNVSLGISGGTALLMIPGLIGGISTDQLLVQFLSGVFTALAFQRYSGEERIVRPAVKALTCHAVFLSVSVLCRGWRDDVLWLQTFQSLLITALVFSCILPCFSKVVLHRNQKKYARLLDTEGELLSQYRKNARLDYLRSMHTAYFCEAIATRLGWSKELMKCCAYYYRWGSDLPELMKREHFPHRCSKILLDYYESEIADIPHVRYRETAALVCADVVLSSMIYLVNSGAELPRYDVIIEAIFERMYRKGSFDKCEISGKELYAVKKIFKEETYYYDSLRRK